MIDAETRALPCLCSPFPSFSFPSLSLAPKFKFDVSVMLDTPSVPPYYLTNTFHLIAGQCGLSRAPHALPPGALLRLLTPLHVPLFGHS